MANCVKMGLGGLNISVVIVLLPKQIPLLRRVQRAEELLSEQHSHRHVYPSAMEKGSSACGCPGDGPCEVQAVNLYSTSGLSGGIMLQNVSLALVDVLQASPVISDCCRQCARRKAFQIVLMQIGICDHIHYGSHYNIIFTLLCAAHSV